MSKIEWTERTWNPVVGCTPVSPGCLNCYAGTLAPRLGAMGQAQYVGLTNSITDTRGHTRRVFNGTVRCVEGALTVPLARKKPTTYFVCSMGDLFHADVPEAFIDRVFAVMALCPQHTFQVLTKRPERMAEYLNMDNRRGYWAAHAIMQGWVPATPPPDGGPKWYFPLRNVWLGTSAEDQARLEERVPHLLRCPAAVRFLSCEPLLEGLNLGKALGRAIDWVIVGGESGARARLSETRWIRGVVDQCKAAGVPVFVKQLGSFCLSWGNDDRVTTDWEFYEARGYVQPQDNWQLPLRDRKGGDPAEWPEDLRVREMPGRAALTSSG